jgi:hypothetical protein
MKFIIKTLIDITQTNARRGDGDAYKQQQNFMSALQTIGIRANPSNIKVTQQEQAVTEFGSMYKGKHTVWNMHFEIEYGATSVDLLKVDFDLVPIINDLSETVKLDTAIFFTKDSKATNIIFEEIDK